MMLSVLSLRLDALIIDVTWLICTPFYLSKVEINADRFLSLFDSKLNSTCNIYCVSTPTCTIVQYMCKWCKCTIFLTFEAPEGDSVDHDE